MKFLIVGLGSIGRRHLRNLLALGERDIVLLRRRAEADAELAAFPTETNLDAALAHRPDAVIVANPTALHVAAALPAARQGCHLLIEKPVASRLDEAENLLAACRQSGSRALVGYHFRQHPGLQALRRLLGENAIGAPLSAAASWGEYLPGWHPGEDYRQGYSARPDLGGGVVLTLSHPLDYLRWLFGEVEACQALVARSGTLGIPVDDSAEINLRFAGGMQAHLHLDYHRRPPAHWLEVIGEQGILRWDNRDGAVRLSQAGGDWQEFPPPPGFERNHLFLAEMQHFLAVCRGAAEPACSLDDGQRTLRLALDILENNRP